MSVAMDHLEHACAAAEDEAREELARTVRQLSGARIEILHGTNDVRRTVGHLLDSIAALDRARAALDGAKMLASERGDR